MAKIVGDFDRQEVLPGRRWCSGDFLEDRGPAAGEFFFPRPTRW
jgi:hypothetical protein